jgi:hypothetical protein
VELGGQWIGDNTSQPFAWQLIVEELGFAVSDAGYSGQGDGILFTTSGPANGTRFSTSNGLMGAFGLLSSKVAPHPLVHVVTRLW